MELMRKREDELSKIYKYTGRGFFISYLAGITATYVWRGRGTPYFKNVMKHSILCVGGTFLSALMAERLSSELYYNRVLISMADKYNFTPEEVLDLQRNLN
jgi:hypothetical protein